ncbi:MAG: peptidyl-prolyl cis-trans isomerase [Trueperaceae bacterium]
MKLSRRANTIILWFVSIGLLAGMVITFTPSLGLGFGGANETGAVALRVNGEPIRELTVAQARSNPLFLSVTEGEVGEDLELLLVDALIRQEVVRQESARQRVSDADVRRAVDEFRTTRGIAGRANDSAYLDLLARSGFTDETFRVYLRQQLQEEAWEAAVIDGVEVDDEEVRAFFEGNRDRYVSEERIEARHIVTDDRETAEEALSRLQAGESAALVARELSVERADRDGALGAAAGETEPRPVGRPALPTTVATAAFALGGPGITDVIESDGRFHVVVVEAYLPVEPRPFDEVAAAVRDDALAAKRSGVLEAEIERLVAAARVEVPEESSLRFDDQPVAVVGDVEIMATDLVRATYTNPQIQQALSPDTAFIITAFFKPSVLAQLVDQELALQGLAELDAPFVGPRAVVAQSALNYVARDAEVDENDVVAYYEQNQTTFTVPASAEVLQVEAGSLEVAAAFRDALLRDGDVALAAEETGAEVVELGLVVPGQLEGLLDLTLFGTDAFEPLPEEPWQVSDILVVTDEVPVLPEALEVDAEAEEGAAETEEGATEAEEGAAEPEEAADAEADEPLTRFVDRYVLLVADRRPERVRPLAEVRSQIESTVLAEARAELREAWVEELRETIDVELLLEDPAAEFDFGLPLDEDVDAAELEEFVESAEEGLAGGEGADGEGAGGEDADGEDADDTDGDGDGAAEGEAESQEEPASE